MYCSSLVHCEVEEDEDRDCTFYQGIFYKIETTISDASGRRSKINNQGALKPHFKGRDVGGGDKPLVPLPTCAAPVTSACISLTQAFYILHCIAL